MGYLQEIAAIYTEEFLGQSQSGGEYPKGMQAATNSKTSTAYSTSDLPGAGPTSNTVSVAAVNPGQGEEEEQLFKEPKRPIKHDLLIDLINKEIHKAHTFGMDYAIMVLIELRDRICKGH